MESDANWPKQSLEVSMPTKFRSIESDKIEAARSISWPICILCIVSITISGVLAYREYLLESRIANLEAQCQIQKSPDLLVQRLRRELQEQFDVYSPHPESTPFFRIKRDIECNCPPGTYPTSDFIHLNLSNYYFQLP